MKRSSDCTHCVARSRSKQLPHTTIVMQLICATVSGSPPSPPITPAIASSSSDMPSSVRPCCTRACPTACIAISSRSELPFARPISAAWRASASLSDRVVGDIGGGPEEFPAQLAEPRSR